eukprot:TRINITY_DN13350_c0_g2_i2.p7 TRINITY_DN13350_c0_g2~~TRINITY_DN13350_c0_g2_i2.p7  ORF type:complete len:106 (+),score=2.70 TRINITY_DN13350_c0_g2_i2:1836-2153(+)
MVWPRNPAKREIIVTVIRMTEMRKMKESLKSAVITKSRLTPMKIVRETDLFLNMKIERVFSLRVLQDDSGILLYYLINILFLYPNYIYPILKLLAQQLIQCYLVY